MKRNLLPLALLLGAIGMNEAVFAGELAPKDLPADGGRKYASKLSLRASAGLFTNAGTTGGATAAAGGLNGVALVYPDSDIALGFGYRADFDYFIGTLPMQGAFVVGRWYWDGHGTRETRKGQEIGSVLQRTYALYAGPALAYSKYYFGANPFSKADVLKGSFMTIEAVAGMDFYVNRRLELNLEGTMGLLTFASDDDRFRFRSFMLLIGISYPFSLN